MQIEEIIKQAEAEGNICYCPNCKKKQPIELTFYDPDVDSDPTMITCLICNEGIGFIDEL